MELDPIAAWQEYCSTHAPEQEEGPPLPPPLPPPPMWPYATHGFYNQFPPPMPMPCVNCGFVNRGPPQPPSYQHHMQNYHHMTPSNRFGTHFEDDLSQQPQQPVAPPMPSRIYPKYMTEPQCYYGGGASYNAFQHTPSQYVSRPLPPQCAPQYFPAITPKPKFMQHYATRSKKQQQQQPQPQPAYQPEYDQHFPSLQAAPTPPPQKTILGNKKQHANHPTTAPINEEFQKKLEQLLALRVSCCVFAHFVADIDCPKSEIADLAKLYASAQTDMFLAGAQGYLQTTQDSCTDLAKHMMEICKRLGPCLAQVTTVIQMWQEAYGEALGTTAFDAIRDDVEAELDSLHEKACENTQALLLGFMHATFQVFQMSSNVSVYQQCIDLLRVLKLDTRQYDATLHANLRLCAKAFKTKAK